MSRMNVVRLSMISAWIVIFVAAHMSVVVCVLVIDGALNENCTIFQTVENGGRNVHI
jgi:hypothetical protein